MISLHQRDNGFTIIELLVVTLVILGLGFLMFNSLADVRAHNRDTERRADINLLHQQLEFYYDIGEASTYPTLDNLKSEDWVKANMEELADSARFDPYGREIGSEGSDYTYEPADCGETGCASYSLSSDQEKSQPDPYTQNSVNNNN